MDRCISRGIDGCMDGWMHGTMVDREIGIEKYS